MKCPSCGCEIEEGVRFCTECGAVPEEQSAPESKPDTVDFAEKPSAPEPEPEPESTLTPEAQSAPVTEQAQPAGSDARNLLTTAQYFFLTLLFQIPIVGLVFLFVWGLGRPRNLSLKRYALATLLLNLAATLVSLLCIIFVLLVMLGAIPNMQFDISAIRFLG